MFPIVEKKRLNDAVVWVKLKAPLIALCGGAAEIAGGIRYLLVVLFAGCIWPLRFWGFSRLGKK